MTSLSTNDINQENFTELGVLNDLVNYVARIFWPQALPNSPLMQNQLNSLVAMLDEVFLAREFALVASNDTLESCPEGLRLMHLVTSKKLTELTQARLGPTLHLAAEVSFYRQKDHTAVRRTVVQATH